MNIVLVIFDSLRKDCIGCYNGGEPGTPAWGWKVKTPHLDALSEESLVMSRAYPESLPTLPARRALYTGQNVYPFRDADFRLKGDFTGAPGWGPIPEDQDTLAEILGKAGYRTGLIADVYHMFKPSKNFWRGFDQWTFLRGQEKDPSRSGPQPSAEEIRKHLPAEVEKLNPRFRPFIEIALKNMYDRKREEDYFNARVLTAASEWLVQNRDAENFFLTVESFDPHEPWFVPDYYRRMYDDDDDGPEQVISAYSTTGPLIRRTRANYSGLVTMCDRWFGHLYETMRVLGLLENTLLIVTTDHGHSIGDRGYLGKRGYPSAPEVYDVPVFIRHPDGIGAGQRSDLFIQHTDLAAQILEFAGQRVPDNLHGRCFFESAVTGGRAIRDHVTVAWGPNVTVINERWWMNCNVDGSGVLLHDLTAAAPFETNVADENPDVARKMFKDAIDDAAGDLPEFLMEMARNQEDAPGCSDLAVEK